MFKENSIATTTCVYVKGYYRSVIIDLHRNTYDYVPASVIDFLILLKKKSINEIYNETPNEFKEVISEYVDFCTTKEYILEIPKEINKAQFPNINLDYLTPSIVTNICVEFDENSKLEFNKLKGLISITNCYTIQLIYSEKYNLNYISKQISELSVIGLRSIELILNYDPKFDFRQLIEIHKNISFIFIYSAPKTELIKEHYFGIQQIFSSEKKFKFRQIKNIDDFNVNISLFTESQKYNTYFNRKLYIGVDGQIKNAPETEDKFGNINSIENFDQILKIINGTKFQKLWKVSKKDIDICKHCEFRHVCVDNRVPKKRHENEYFNEIECNYNPYIAKWNKEDGYKTLAECGISSNKDGFIINRKKINAINKELWND